MVIWFEISVFCPQVMLEEVANLFNEMGSGGVVIDDPALIVSCINNGNNETLSPSLKSPSITDQAGVKGYFAVESAASGHLEELLAQFKLMNLTWTTREVREEDWANAWRAYYKPIRVGKKFIIKPSWEDYNPGQGEMIIELDPGMAFGCGTHETTSMCLALLEEELYGGEVVYDVGTGSGILSVAAAMLGAGRVLAVDIDEVAVRTARENAGLNNVTDIVTVQQGNLLEKASGVKADLVVANIIADVIKILAPDAAAVLKAGGKMIASGIIRERAEEVAESLNKVGLKPERRLEKGEWVALVCKKCR